MTVLEVIQRSTDFLAKKGAESPRLQIELLLAHVLQLPRLKLYLNFDRRLRDDELERLRALVKRRGNREPLQHLVGSASFCGLEITVNRHVLIPRPETELLAERAAQFLKERPAATVLDFGTGSGCLAIALAVKCPDATVLAADVSEEALQVARGNAARHGVGTRIQFHLGDGFAAVPGHLRFDLIVSNPPYIASAEIAALEPEVRDHDPRVALDGGADGLDFYRRLAAEAPAFLKPGGCALLEFGDGQETALLEMLEEQKWIVGALERDYSGRPRMLIAARQR
ncbi:MAG TPA: peptide chain release factor N(5)-glutamine methyltransferase [Verrucomicrobiae bacterium]